MKFSPYKIRDVSGVDIYEEDDEFIYDSDDSEDLQYPVYELSSAVTWKDYNEETRLVVAEALHSKSEQILRAASMQDRIVHSKLDQVLADVESLNMMLTATKLEYELEDRNRKLLLESSNAKLKNASEHAIEKVKLAEAQRLQRIAEAEAEARRLEEEKRASEARAEAQRIERCRKEKEESDRKIAQANQRLQEERLASEAEQEAEARAQAEADQQKKLQGTSPQDDAVAWRDRLEAFKLEVLKPVSESKDLKNYCHRARLRINPKIGQVTISIDQIKTVSSALKAIFEEARKQDAGGLALKWCLNFFCKAIVRQAEGEVMVKPTAAYPLAFLAISLMGSFPDLLDIYLCRIAKKCPWTIPYIAYNKDTEEGRKRLGYKRAADSKYESPTAYLERQSGIFILWVATASLDFKVNPLPIASAWKFLARLLNTKIDDEELRNVAYAMTASFIEIAGKTFMKNYGDQGLKMLRAVAIWVGPDAKGANAGRLRTIVEEAVLQGTVGIDFNFER